MSPNTWTLRIQSVVLQVLGEQMSDFPLPDVALVAERQDPLNTGRLLQLILGCAVKCERKQGSLSPLRGPLHASAATANTADTTRKTHVHARLKTDPDSRVRSRGARKLAISDATLAPCVFGG